MTPMLRRTLLSAVIILPAATASAQNEPINPFLSPDAPGDIPQSQCIALARNLDAQPGVAVEYASLDAPIPAVGTAGGNAVTISFATHSTYVIETPEGVTIATDYAGWAGPGVTPNVITMNRAHSSHYTMSPDPAIEHVLPGWGEVPGEPAAHAEMIGDVYVRNVTTDIDRWGERSPDANSIFIFEVADLCIGHLGHLHHRLTDEHYAQIGRLDILMVPVDGGLTLNHDGMTEVVERLRSSIILPMHRRGAPLSSFINMLGEGYLVENLDEPTMTVTLGDLPRTPTVVVMPGI